MSDESAAPEDGQPRRKRLGPLGYLRAMVIARTAAVSWPEAKEMARKSAPDPDGPVDIVKDSERPQARNGP